MSIICTAKALFEYVAQAPDELSFQENATIYVTANTEDWWTGSTDPELAALGVFPKNYVEVLSEGAGELQASQPETVVLPQEEWIDQPEAQVALQEVEVEQPQTQVVLHERDAEVEKVPVEVSASEAGDGAGLFEISEPSDASVLDSHEPELPTKEQTSNLVEELPVNDGPVVTEGESPTESLEPQVGLQNSNESAQSEGGLEEQAVETKLLSQLQQSPLAEDQDSYSKQAAETETFPKLRQQQSSDEPLSLLKAQEQRTITDAFIAPAPKKQSEVVNSSVSGAAESSSSILRKPQVTESSKGVRKHRGEPKDDAADIQKQRMELEDDIADRRVGTLTVTLIDAIDLFLVAGKQLVYAKMSLSENQVSIGVGRSLKKGWISWSDGSVDFPVLGSSLSPILLIEVLNKATYPDSDDISIGYTRIDLSEVVRFDKHVNKRFQLVHGSVTQGAKPCGSILLDISFKKKALPPKDHTDTSTSALSNLGERQEQLLRDAARDLNLDESVLRFMKKLVNESINDELQRRAMDLQDLSEKVHDLRLTFDNVGSQAAPQKAVSSGVSRMSPIAQAQSKQLQIGTVLPTIKTGSCSLRASSYSNESRKNQNSAGHEQREGEPIKLPKINSRGSESVEKQSTKNQKEALQQRLALRYPQCRSLVYAPTSSLELPASTILPDVSLELEYIYGDFHMVAGEIVFAASAVVAVLDSVVNSQRFFLGHTSTVTALAVHPNGSIVASGQEGRSESPVYVWDAIGDGGSHMHTKNSSSLQALQVLKYHSNTVTCLDFSPDGVYLLSLGQDETPTVVVWDWANGELLHSSKIGSAGSYVMQFHKYFYLGKGEVDNPEDQVYTLLSIGVRHIKFWTFSSLSQTTAHLANEPIRSPKKLRQPLTLRWVLHSTFGRFAKHSEAMDYTCACSLKEDSDDAAETLGRYITGTATGELIAWVQTIHNQSDEKPNQPKGKYLSTHTGHQGAVNYLIYEAKSHRLASCGEDGIIQLWRVDCGNLPALSPLLFIEMESEGRRLGQPICMDWTAVKSDQISNTLVVGTSGNVLAMVDLLNAEKNLPCLRVLLSGKAQKIDAMESHPSLNYVYVSDSTRGCCISIRFDGKILAVGHDTGDISLLVLDDGGNETFFCEKLAQITIKSDAVALKSPQKLGKGSVDNKPATQTGYQYPSKTKSQASQYAVQCIKYSPNGNLLAVASREGVISVFDCRKKYRRVAQLKGHSSCITNFDWSMDSRKIQSVDHAKEILYWNVAEGKQLLNSFELRDVDWRSWTCLYGWPVHGIWGDGVAACVRRSNQGDIIAVGYDSQKVKLYRFPCVQGSQARSYFGHACAVGNAAFTLDDSRLLTSSVADTALFQWRLFEQNGLAHEWDGSTDTSYTQANEGLSDKSRLTQLQQDEKLPRHGSSREYIAEEGYLDFA